MYNLLLKLVVLLFLAANVHGQGASGSATLTKISSKEGSNPKWQVATNGVEDAEINGVRLDFSVVSGDKCSSASGVQVVVRGQEITGSNVFPVVQSGDGLYAYVFLGKVSVPRNTVVTLIAVTQGCAMITHINRLGGLKIYGASSRRPLPVTEFPSTDGTTAKQVL